MFQSHLALNYRACSKPGVAENNIATGDDNWDRRSYQQLSTCPRNTFKMLDAQQYNLARSRQTDHSEE